MKERFLSKRTGRPSHHSRAGNRDPIDASSLVRDIAPNFLETLPSKKLALSGNVILSFKAVGFRTISVLSKNCSSDTQAIVFYQLTQKKLEMIFVQGNIRIQIPYDLVSEVLHLLLAGVECVNLCGEIAILDRKSTRLNSSHQIISYAVF